MTENEAKTVNLIFNITVFAASFVVAVVLLLAYFDCLVK